MNKKLAMKWVKALRSGRYKQATGVLVKTDHDSAHGPSIEDKVLGHCCLGVLAEVCGIDREKLLGLELLEGITDQVGLQHEDGEAVNDKEPDSQILVKVPVSKNGKRKTMEFPTLAEANDKGASFKAIATWIEKNYKFL